MEGNKEESTKNTRDASPRRHLREKLLAKKLGKMGSKYASLVSLARKEDPDDPRCADFVQWVQTRYPKESEELSVPGRVGDWQHGFHSGILATVRRLAPFMLDDEELEERRENWGEDEEDVTLDETLRRELEFAKESWPDLDT